MKVVLFENPELNYHFNMNVDQSTRALPTICTCKNVIWIFFYPAHEMPTLFLCDLFHHDRGWENESILGRIGGYIYFVNLGSNVITSRK